MNCIIDSQELRAALSHAGSTIQLSERGVHCGPLCIRLDSLLTTGTADTVTIPTPNPPLADGIVSVFTEFGVVVFSYPDGTSEVLFDDPQPELPPVGQPLGLQLPERVFLAAVPFVTTPRSQYADRSDLYYIRWQGSTLTATDSRSVIALPVPVAHGWRYLLPMPTDGPVVIHEGGQVSGRFSLYFQQPRITWPQLPHESAAWRTVGLHTVTELPDGISILPEEEKRIHQSLRGQDYTIELRNEKTPIVYRGSDRSIMVMPMSVK